VLESKRFVRVGETREREIDIRVIAATNRNLAEDVEAGRFRRDLYFRLNGAKVMLPPLRERRRELALLARTFLDEACRRLEVAPKHFAPAALLHMVDYPWPGNVRELRNVAEFVAAASIGDEVSLEDLPTEVLGRPASPQSQEPPPRNLADEIAELEQRRM